MEELPKGLASGAVDFKGWYTIVWVTPGELVWPERCACCTLSSEATAKIEDDKSLRIADYPICKHCIKHAKVDDIAVGIALLGSAVLVLGAWAWSGFLIWSYFILFFIILFLIFALVFGALYWLINLFVGNKSSRCPDGGWPISMHRLGGFGPTLGKDGERSDDKALRLWNAAAQESLPQHSVPFEFKNSDYAGQFIEANGGDSSKIQKIDEKF